jgi:hypothetical protein
MPFFAREHIRLALQYLPDHTHPSLLSLLTMFRMHVPAAGVAGAVPFGSADEHELLDAYFRPAGGTEERPWYLPFGKPRPGSPHWKTHDYGGSSLQRMRRDRPWIYPAEIDAENRAVAFGLPADLVQVLENQHTKVLGGIPLSIHHLAAWMYRERPVASHSAAIADFVAEFNLDAYGLVGPVFSPMEDPDLSAIPLSDAPASAEEVEELLEALPQEGDVQHGGAQGGAEAEEAAEEEDTSAGSWNIDQPTLSTASMASLSRDAAAVGSTHSNAEASVIRARASLGTLLPIAMRMGAGMIDSNS